MGVGKKMRMIRRSKDLSQDVIADRVGITAAYVSRIENEIADPDTELVRKIADALEVSVAVLFDVPGEVVDIKGDGEIIRADVPMGARLGLVPFLGRIMATPEGKQYFDDEGIPQGAAVPFFLDNKAGLFALEIENDSLINAQPEEIYPGDICIFSSTEQPKNGDIVAVQLVQSHERMVKILHHVSREEVELRSANKFRNYLSVKLKKDQIATFGVYVAKLKMSDERKKKYGLKQ